MENSLIHHTRQESVKNDTVSLKNYIFSQLRRNSNIDDKFLNDLFSIASDNDLEGVKCVLACLKFLCENDIDQSMWDNLADKLAALCVMCLHKCIEFYSKCEVNKIVAYLLEVVSDLMDETEMLVKAFHSVMIQPLIKLITEEDLVYDVKFDLLKTLVCIVKNSNKENNCEINPKFQKETANLANWILLCGDYEMQTYILEVLFHMSDLDNVDEFCSDWFDLYPQIKREYSNLDFLDFDTVSRKFLNFMNKSTKNQLVYSLGCIYVFSNGIKLQKPNDLNYPTFWVDFNIYSKSVLIIYQSDDNELWEKFCIENNNVLKVYTSGGEYNLNNHLIPIVKLCVTISSHSTTKSIQIWFQISEEFLNLEINFLIPIYGMRYESNWKASTSNSILSREALSSEVSGSVNRSFCSGKYLPLPVVITPSKSVLNNKSSFSHLEILQSSDKLLQQDSNPSGQSSCDKILQSNNIIVDESDESYDEVCPSPEIVVRKVAKFSTKNQMMVKRQQSEASEKVVDQEISDIEVDLNLKSHPGSKANGQEKVNSNVTENEINSLEYNIISEEHIQSAHNQVVENVQTGIDETEPIAETQIVSNNDAKQSPEYKQHCTNKDTIKHSRIFFKSDLVVDSLPITTTPQSSNKVKSVYSISSSSSEKVKKAIKETDARPKNVKRKRKKVKTSLITVSRSDSVLIPEPSMSKTIGIPKIKQTNSSYVSKLSKKVVDPLRFSSENHEEHIDLSEVSQNIEVKEKKIGKRMFGVFHNLKESLEENYFPGDELADNVPNEPLAIIGDTESVTKRKSNKENILMSKKPRNIKRVTYENTVCSDNEMEIDSAYISLKRKKSAPLKESDFNIFGKSVIQNFVINVEEKRKTEMELLHDHFDSQLESAETKLSVVLDEVDKCKKYMDRVKDNVNNERKIHLANIAKQSAAVVKCVNNFNSNIQELSRSYVESLKK